MEPEEAKESKGPFQIPQLFNSLSQKNVRQLYETGLCNAKKRSRIQAAQLVHLWTYNLRLVASGTCENLLDLRYYKEDSDKVLWLRNQGKKDQSQYCMNITDIDDKIIKRSNELNIPFREFCKKWERAFFRDMESLQIDPPDVLTRVSEFVPQIKEFIKKIIDNGYAYKTETGSVYFDVMKFKEETGHQYPKLMPQAFQKENIEEMLEEGEGVLSKKPQKEEQTEKKNKYDFALWKASKPGEPSWPSEWGEGRPGWHIECSTMANQVFGNTIDIHAGGKDLRFPHHDNEIAQSEAFYNNNHWINHWWHAGQLKIEGRKMSKSLKNYITIEYLASQYPARVFRIFFLLHHWDKKIDYSKTSLEEAKQKDKNFKEFFLNIKANTRKTDITDITQKWNKADFELNQALTKAQEKIKEALLNNLDTVTALLEIGSLMKTTNTYMNQTDAAKHIKIMLLMSVAEYIEQVFHSFGLEYRQSSGSDEEQSKEPQNVEQIVSPYIDLIVKFRDEIKELTFAKAQPSAFFKVLDGVRDQALPNLGVRLEDKKKGEPSLWKFASREEILKEIAAKKEAEAKKEDLKKQKAEEELKKRSTPPDQWFKVMSTDFIEYDEKGVPTIAADGKPVSEVRNKVNTQSKRKKLVKKLEQQAKVYNQWLEEQQKKSEDA